jgi:hypothetical protein
MYQFLENDCGKARLSIRHYSAHELLSMIQVLLKIVVEERRMQKENGIHGRPKINYQKAYYFSSSTL